MLRSVPMNAVDVGLEDELSPARSVWSNQRKLTLLISSQLRA